MNFLVDTHCHINFDSYDADRAAVIERAGAAGVTRIVNPAIDVESSRKTCDLCEKFSGLYLAIGIHPNSTSQFEDSQVDELGHLATHPKVVAIGEIGLDYYRDRSPRAKQVQAFEAQLALAARLELPVIIHNREASEDVIAILESWGGSLPAALKDRPGVLHSFSASQAIAERALEIGFYLGFTGPITYKKADDLRRIASSVPLSRLLVETDGPFLTPEPYRGKRNEPAYIPYIVERLASLKSLTDSDISRATTDNAARLFGLNS